MDLILDRGCTHLMVSTINLPTDAVINVVSDKLGLGQVFGRYGARPGIMGRGSLWPLDRLLLCTRYNSEFNLNQNTGNTRLHDKVH